MLDACARLAGQLQRPPTRKELMEAVDWRGGIKEFTIFFVMLALRG